MHMHKMFMKMHKKHRGPRLHELFQGKHGFGLQMKAGRQQLGPHKMHKLHHEMGPHMKHKLGHKPHIREHYKMHPLMFHGINHGKHGKLHHKKHHWRPSFTSSSSSSESEDEFLVEEQRGKNNHNDCPPNQGHPHKKPSPDIFQIMHGPHERPHQVPPHDSNEMLNYIPEPGEVLPFMKRTHNGPFYIRHKMGHHKMHHRKPHKKHEMRHHITPKSGRKGHGHHMMHKPDGVCPRNGIHFHQMHHHRMHKMLHQMKQRSRSSSHSSSSSSSHLQN